MIFIEDNMSIEISLSELEDWYSKSLQELFKKEHKIMSKLFAASEKEIAEARISLKTWTKRTLANEDTELDPKNQKIMERFIEHVVETIDEIKIPSVQVDISYENNMNFIEGIKKIYTVYNNQGRKSIPRFGKAYKIEIKEIDMHLRKLGNYSAKLNKFLIKNYQKGKNAENLMKKIPLLRNNIDRLGVLKQKNEEMEKNYLDMQNNLKEMEDQLYNLSLDPDLQKYEKIEQEEQKKSLDLSEALKFKKAFKKLIKALEKGNINSRGIRLDHLKAYIKSPVNQMLDEGPKIPQLKDLLIKTRLILEDEDDPLKLKSDLKEKIIENITQIVSDNVLESEIQEILKIKEEKDEMKKILDKKGLQSKRDEFKEKIALMTMDSEHFNNDLRHRKREFKELLEKIGNDRNELQNLVSTETGQDFKLKVIIPN